ncbi:MAG: acyl--CoA ligase [Nitrospirae bacterium]|nr:acyl--CoA ligase [Candidatus Manganitrophaceae bacterium]
MFLFFKEQEVTYRQLDERTERIAENLARFKVQPGEKVALLLPNIPEFLFAFFGVLKHGAVVVPMNPGLRGEEVARLLEHSESRVLVTTPTLYSMIAPKRTELSRLQLLFLVGERGGVGKVFSSLYVAGGPRRPEEIGPNDPAALIYTSGTTGWPKGVVLTDHNYLFSAAQFSRAMELSEQDRLLGVLPLSEVGSQVILLLASLFSGGSLVLMERFSPAEVFMTLERFRVTAFAGMF